MILKTDLSFDEDKKLQTLLKNFITTSNIENYWIVTKRAENFFEISRHGDKSIRKRVLNIPMIAKYFYDYYGCQNFKLLLDFCENDKVLLSNLPQELDTKLKNLIQSLTATEKMENYWVVVRSERGFELTRKELCDTFVHESLYKLAGTLCVFYEHRDHPLLKEFEGL